MSMHHARLFIGASEQFGIEDSAIETREVSFDQFGIEDARLLTEEAKSTPLYGEYKRFCLTINSITHEAQNALLKLFEDPPSTSRFEVCMPTGVTLLPTLRSRFEIVEEITESNKTTSVDSDILRMGDAECLELLAVKIKEKDTKWIDDTLNEIEKNTPSSNDEMQRAVVFARGYIGMRGASKKMLLEHLALTLPQ